MFVFANKFRWRERERGWEERRMRRQEGGRERKIEMGETGHTQRELYVIKDMQKELTTQGRAL